MKWIDEAVMRRYLDEDMAFRAAEQVFRSIGAGTAQTFDSVRNAIGYKDALFGNKSGFDGAIGALGLKAGGYWCHNEEQGLPNHQSVTLLFDPDTGQAKAAASGNHLTAMRTAAAAAVSIDRLSRPDSGSLSIIGAGVQAGYHIQAALEVRDFKRVLIWNRTADRAEQLAAEMASDSLTVQTGTLDEVVSQADVLVTVVSAFEPVVPASLISAGTHIAAMGTDTVGKQELETEIFGLSRAFTDDLKQSTSLGEAQHAIASGIIEPADIISMSDVISGSQPGRESEDQITLYDGTGLGLQDLITVKAVLSAMDQS